MNQTKPAIVPAVLSALALMLIVATLLLPGRVSAAATEQVVNVDYVIALLDAGDPHHAAAVEAVGHARREELVLPSSAYAGCSVHSVPSLSKVAMRCGTGTKSVPPSVVVRLTKSTIAVFAAPSFHEGSASVCDIAELIEP